MHRARGRAASSPQRRAAVVGDARAAATPLPPPHGPSSSMSCPAAAARPAPRAPPTCLRCCPRVPAPPPPPPSTPTPRPAGQRCTARPASMPLQRRLVKDRPVSGYEADGPGEARQRERLSVRGQHRMPRRRCKAADEDHRAPGPAGSQSRAHTAHPSMRIPLAHSSSVFTWANVGAQQRHGGTSATLRARRHVRSGFASSCASLIQSPLLLRRTACPGG